VKIPLQLVLFPGGGHVVGHAVPPLARIVVFE
jgi:hypothetical protein